MAGSQARDAAKAVQVWSNGDAHPHPILEKNHALKEPPPLPTHRALKTPAFYPIPALPRGGEREPRPAS